MIRLIMCEGENELEIITHVGEKNHGFNREDDSPSFYFCRYFID
jgi:hypothetical protein